MDSIQYPALLKSLNMESNVEAVSQALHLVLTAPQPTPISRRQEGGGLFTLAAEVRVTTVCFPPRSKTLTPYSGVSNCQDDGFPPKK